jgi:hypothetical protein
MSKKQQCVRNLTQSIRDRIAESLILAKAEWLKAEQAQEIREALLAKIRKIFDELYEVRNAKKLAQEGQVHVYRALSVFARAQEAILSNASLDEIQGLLEEGDAEVSQIERSHAEGPTKMRSKGA